jgi:hypothetical protein
MNSGKKPQKVEKNNAQSGRYVEGTRLKAQGTSKAQDEGTR